MKGHKIMTCKLLASGMVLAIAVISFSALAHNGDDAKVDRHNRKSDVGQVKLQKKGGLSPEDRWAKNDVAKYLKLPYRFGVEGFIAKLKRKKGVGEYAIVKMHLPGHINKKDRSAVSFRVCDEDLSVYDVTLYDHRSWNAICEKVSEHIMNSVALWNKIPQYYSVKRDDKTYSITKRGERPEKWYFDLRQMLILHVAPQFSKEKVEKSEEYKIEQINAVVGEMMKLIEANGTSSNSQKEKYRKTKQRYQKAGE